jgi:Putative DNA-binding domain
MVRFTTFLNSRTPNEALLREYLQPRSEWIGLEFKEAGQVPTMGIRKTVAAFANLEGGDLFLGVNDQGVPVGTRLDPVQISEILRQEGAPAREGVTTNLVEVVRPPVVIPLSEGSKVYLIDVDPHGRLVAALHPDGTLGLCTRPGANSEEVGGFEAIYVFRQKTRARLLHSLLEEYERIAKTVSRFPMGPGYPPDDLAAPIRRVVDSREWDLVANSTDKDLVPSGG